MVRFGAERARLAAPEDTFEACAPLFEHFYASHRSRITEAVALTIGDSMLADDATSEAMIKAHQRWNDVSGFDNPSGWVYRVAVNHARGWRRTFRRRGTTTGDVPEDIEHDVQIDDGAIAAAIAALPHHYRTVVVCRLFLDWSTEDTAAALGVARGTVKSRLARALSRLRVTLGEHE